MSELSAVVVTTSYPVKSNPQSGVFVKRLVHALRDRGVGSEVVLPADRFSSENDCEVFLPYAPRKFRSLAHNQGGIPESIKHSRLNVVWAVCLVCLLFVVTIFRARRHDLVLANWSVCGAVAGLGKIFHRKPVITVFRGTDVKEPLRGLSKLFVRLSIRYSDRVVCVSSDMHSTLSDMFPDVVKKFCFISNGVDLSTPPSQQVLEGRLRLLAVGNLTKNKNFGVVLSAVSRMPSGSVELTIVGDGDQKLSLENSIQALGLKSCVRLIGAVPPEMVGEYYDSADALVLPSFSEGRSNVLLEAMANGLCVVASDITSNRSLIEHERSGYLFDPNSSQALRDILSQLVSHPRLMRTAGSSARDVLVDQELTWEACSAAYEALFREVTS